MACRRVRGGQSYSRLGVSPTTVVGPPPQCGQSCSPTGVSLSATTAGAHNVDSSHPWTRKGRPPRRTAGPLIESAQFLPWPGPLEGGQGSNPGRVLRVNRHPKVGDETACGLRMRSPAGCWPVWIQLTSPSKADCSSGVV